jgi:hypothetical protein
MRVIVTCRLRRNRIPDLNSYVCCLWSILKGKGSVTRVHCFWGGGLENSTRRKVVNRHISNKALRHVSGNNFRTCEVCLEAGSRYFWTWNSHRKRTLNSPADASFAVATAAVPRDMACGKRCTICTYMTCHSACHHSVPVRYIEQEMLNITSKTVKWQKLGKSETAMLPSVLHSWRLLKSTHIQFNLKVWILLRLDQLKIYVFKPSL